MAARVLVIGLDAAERSIVLDLVARGRMPALRSLFDQGAHTALDAPPHVYVGAAWPTLYTGAPPGIHGRWAPQVMRRDAYETEWCGARSAIEPFWGDLAQRGLRVAAVDVPLAPLVPRANVTQLAEWATHDNVGAMATWSDDRRDPFADVAVVPMDSCDTLRMQGRLGDLRRHLLDSIERKTRLIEGLTRFADWDLLFAVYGESHCIGHQGWDVHDRDDGNGDPIVDVYEALDDAIGRVLTMQDAETTVSVILSHGMGPHYDGSHLLGELLTRIETACFGPTSRVVRWREAGIRRVRRARRHAQPAHPQADGAFGRAVDGSRRFFRVPNAAPVGCVRVNVAGREPRGRVRAGAEFEGVCEVLERELLALVDPADGAPLVANVTPVAAAHDGPFASEFGDLFVEWRRDRPIVAAASSTVGVVEGAYRGRSGDHHPGGLLVASGPTVQPRDLAAPLSGEAFVPLVYGWLGIDRPERLPTPPPR